MSATYRFPSLARAAWAVLTGLALAGPVAAQQAGEAARVYRSDEVDQLPAMPGAIPHRKPVPAPGQFVRYVNTEDLASAVEARLVLPAAVRSGQAEGIVSVEFEVTAAGRIAKPRMYNSLCPTCDTAALLALRQLPPLQPARYQGQPVATTVVVTVRMISPDHVYSSSELGYYAYFSPGRLYRYLQQQMRLPPVVTVEKVQGRVRVGFIVRPTGQLDSVRIASALCKSCDAEALRLVRAMPAWAPAHDAKGRPVATRQFVDIFMPLPDPAAPYNPTERPRTYAEKQPTLPDGRTNLGGAISREVPYSAAMRRDSTLRGYAGLEFVVDAGGIVRQPRITKPLRPDFDQAVMAALASLGPLLPAQEYHQNVPFLAQVRVFTTPRPAPTSER